jgi:HlyD family secretion protein
VTNNDTKTPVTPGPPSNMEIRHGDVLAPVEKALVPVRRTTPVASERPSPTRGRSRWEALALLGLVIGAGGGGAYWWYSHQRDLPIGIVSGNGRIEADEIDIDTKFAGRIAEMLADEGDMVKAGQVVARMDTQDLAASLRKSQAQVQEAQQSLDEARAGVEQQKTQVTLAQQEFDRTNTLVARGFATNELLDQRRQALNGANAALNAANDRVGEAERARDAATHDVELYKVNIADNTLVAPREGRLQYRIANIGEVLPAGGRVFTMLDVAYVYMDVYLPTAEAGKVRAVQFSEL